MAMVFLEYKNNERMAIDTSAVIRMTECSLTDSENKVIGPAVEIMLITGSVFAVPDPNRALFDFLILQRGDGYNADDKTIKVGE